MRYAGALLLVVLAAGCPTRPRSGIAAGGGDGSVDAGDLNQPDGSEAGERPNPSIAIVAPASMVFASGDVPIEVEVSGGSVSTVQLLRNDVAWQEISGPPFRYTWDTRPAPDGNYTLSATATVEGELLTSAPVTVWVDHTPPRVTEVIPARGNATADLTAPLKLVFSEPVVPSTVNTGSLQLTVGATSVPATVVLAADAMSLTATIANPQALTLPAEFAGAVAATVTDRAGNPLAPLDPPWTWTVPAWIKLPAIATEMPPRLALDGNQRPVLLYVTLDNVNGNDVFDVRVARFESGAWNTTMGAPTATADTARNGYSLALDSKGQPVVAWTETFVQAVVHVAAWTGASWNAAFPALDAINDVGRNASFPCVRVDSADRPVVAWREVTGTAPTYDAFAARWTGTDWTRLNGTGFMGGAGFQQLLDGPQLVLDAQDNPIFGWSEGGGIGTGVSFWKGTDWVRSQPLVGGYTPYPALDTTGIPWLAVKSTDLHVLKWNASMLNWIEAGPSPLVTSSSWSAPRLALAPDGSPVVAWVDTSSGVRIGIARWKGTAWDTRFGLFNAGQSPATNIVPELVVDARGKIWVAWREGLVAQVWMSNY